MKCLKCLVTGGTGFIGHHLAAELLKQGHEVLVTGSCPERVPKGAKFLPHDLNGIDWRYVAGIDVCYHQAANNKTTEEDHETMMRSNFYASSDLFNAIRLHSDCNKIVYASSTAVYGKDPTPFREKNDPNPLNVYGVSKLRLDQYAISFGMKYDINIVGLRYCNVYGPGEEHKGPRMSMITKMANQLKRGEQVKLFKDGQQLREWIYVKDVVRANLLASEYKGQAIFNCATGNPYTFEEVFNTLQSHLGTSQTVEWIDNPISEMYQDNVHTDMNKAQEFLGFIPQYDLMDGIKDYT